MKVLKSLKICGFELMYSKVVNFVWPAYCMRPSRGSVGQRYPASLKYLGAFCPASTTVFPLRRALVNILDMGEGLGICLTYHIRCPAAISSVAIALVIAVGCHS